LPGLNKDRRGYAQGGQTFGGEICGGGIKVNKGERGIVWGEIKTMGTCKNGIYIYTNNYLSYLPTQPILAWSLERQQTIFYSCNLLCLYN